MPVLLGQPPKQPGPNPSRNLGLRYFSVAELFPSIQTLAPFGVYIVAVQTAKRARYNPRGALVALQEGVTGRNVVRVAAR